MAVLKRIFGTVLSILWLILPVLLLVIGLYQSNRYENGVEVQATVTRVKEHEDIDPPYSTQYTAYGNYEIDGTLYENKRLDTKYDTPFYVGQTITVIVDPLTPNGVLSDGGLLIVPGFLWCGWRVWNWFADRKKQKAVCPPPQETPEND